MTFTLKSIKNLIFENDGGENQPTEKKTSTKTVVEPAVKSTPVPTVIPVDVSSGKPDNAIADSLASALEKANIDGVDYFEFAKILQGLSASIPAEQMRYQAAFASVAAMNATKKVLLETADHYLGVLKSEADNFSKIVAQQTDETVTKKEDSLAAIDASIKEKTDLMNQITAEINQMANDRTVIINEVAENKLSIEKVQNNFAATLKTFIDKINGDKAKIEQYIVG